jgi:hypothetical protein
MNGNLSGWQRRLAFVGVDEYLVRHARHRHTAVLRREYPNVCDVDPVGVLSGVPGKNAIVEI